MKYHITTFFLIAAVVGLSLFLFDIPVFASGNYGLNDTANAARLTVTETPTEIAGRIIGAALSLVGVLFFILMLYAGIEWMVARGNTEQSQRALRTIIAAIIGLVIILASYAITSFIFESVSNTDLGPGGAIEATP
jgi:membrane-anchored protein YejM (alkaline phosphatase superfamily)